MSVAVGIALGAAAANGAAVASKGGSPAVWMALMYVSMVPYAIVMFKCKTQKTANIATALILVVGVAMVPIAIKLSS